MSLNLLLDNANPVSWERWLPSGFFKGITTNPTLLREAGQPCNLTNLEKLANKASILGCNELHLQSWGKSKENIRECGMALAKLKTPTMQVYVKIPITEIGIEAARELIDSDIPVTLTACYESKQVLIAAALKASYIAPYMGRINDLGTNGSAEIISMKKILKGIQSDCKLLVASVRKSHDLCALASEGINTFAVSTKVTEELFHSEKTLKAAERFELDAEQNNAN